MSRRVFLHVGVPKSGTTFLQSSLTLNRKVLHEAGVLYPGGQERMFLAALDVRGGHKAWGRSRAEVDGSWDTLCRKARAHDGTTVISHELFAAASAHQITAALTMLKGLEVHVVVTARDPARQAAAEWQEGVKHGRRLCFEQFRRRVLDGASETDYARRFRASQDLPAVLARANASLGTVEIDLLRRVNEALDKRLVQPEYGRVVKEIDRAGYDVQGDLAALVPVAPELDGPHPDDVDPRDGLDSAVAATAELLLEVQRGRSDVARLEAENAKLAKKRKRLKRRLRAATDE